MQNLFKLSIYLFSFSILLYLFSSCTRAKYLKLNANDVVFQTDTIVFTMFKYAPIEYDCKSGLYTSQAIGLVNVSRDRIDTIRVISICSKDDEMIDFIKRGIDFGCEMSNYRDSSVLKNDIYIKNIPGFSNKKLKTYFADVRIRHM